MRTSLLTPFLTLLAAATAAATAAGPTTTTTVTLFVPPSQALPNPRALPPSTHATLTSRGAAAAAYLTPSNTFLFRNVSEGSYLLDVHCGTHAFAPLRVDVLPLVAGDTNNDNNGEETAPASLTVKAWETYRGNDWDNKGEALGGGVKFEVRVLGAKAFFAERSSFNILSILKNPMILLGMVSMAIFVGMPYLVDNMDPEMRKEWEESQKSNPMNSIMGGGQSGGAGNFDMAAFLAGSSPKDSNNNNNGGGGAASGGPKKEKGGRK